MKVFTTASHHFGMFRFDARRLRLYRDGEQVALRPKTAVLLRCLLASPDQVVSKQQILNDVWGRDGVSDQTVFQTVSDLRRSLQPLDPIVTHPNRGYCFALPVQRLSRARRWSCAAAACATVAAMTLWWTVPASQRSSASAQEHTSMSPALQAFATGVDLLQRDDPRSAERYFRLASQENPEFADARLMIGEALLAQGRVQDARAHTEAFLAARHVPDYAGVTAMSLISRTQDAAGQPASALHWALAAARQAYDQGYVCAAAGIEDQIERLIAQHGDAYDDAATGSQLEADASQVRSPLSADDTVSAAHCVDLGAGPDARWVPEACVPVRVASRRRNLQTTFYSIV